MFNESQKLEYIEEYLSDDKISKSESVFKSSCIAIFENATELEESLGKDCAEFTAPEITTLYKSISTASVKYLTVVHSQLQRYADWCLSRNLLSDGQNHYFTFDTEQLVDCINKSLAQNKIVTKEQLYHDIRPGGELVNTSDRCLALAIFEGICGENYCDLVNLDTSQIRKGNQLSLYSGKTLEVSKQLIDLMEESSLIYESYLYSPKGENEFVERKYDITDARVFKRNFNATGQNLNAEGHMKEADLERQRIYYKLQRLQKAIGSPAYSASGLRESGRINMINEYSLIEDADPSAIISKYRKEISERYGNIPSITKYMLAYSELFFKLQKKGE